MLLCLGFDQIFQMITAGRLDNLFVESKYRLKVFLNDVPSQVDDNHDLCV